jgi:hypothetical protein
MKLGLSPARTTATSSARFAALAHVGVDLAIVDLPNAQDPGVFEFLGRLVSELEPFGRRVDLRP